MKLEVASSGLTAFRETNTPPPVAQPRPHLVASGQQTEITFATQISKTSGLV
jgi:hypothetical protein